MGLNPTVEFNALQLSHGDVVLRRRDTIPQILDELNTLGDRECIEIDVVRRIAHALSLPACGRIGNTHGSMYR
jgi:hypothetical protein